MRHIWGTCCRDKSQVGQQPMVAVFAGVADNYLNTPAMPLNDAHFGGFFIAWRQA